MTETGPRTATYNDAPGIELSAAIYTQHIGHADLIQSLQNYKVSIVSRYVVAHSSELVHSILRYILIMAVKTYTSIDFQFFLQSQLLASFYGAPQCCALYCYSISVCLSVRLSHADSVSKRINGG